MIFTKSINLIIFSSKNYTSCKLKLSHTVVMYQLGPQSKNYDPALSKKYLLEENQTKYMFQCFLYRKHIILVALSDQFFKLSIFQFQFLSHGFNSPCGKFERNNRKTIWWRLRGTNELLKLKWYLSSFGRVCEWVPNKSF